MRSALSRLIAGLLLIAGFGLPVRAEPVPAAQTDVYGIEFPTGRVLPSGDLDLPAAPLAGGDRGPVIQSVQAIPTPTAFHAGLGVMVAALVYRRLRRVGARSAGR